MRSKICIVKHFSTTSFFLKLSCRRDKVFKMSLLIATNPTHGVSMLIKIDMSLAPYYKNCFFFFFFAVPLVYIGPFVNDILQYLCTTCQLLILNTLSLIPCMVQVLSCSWNLSPNRMQVLGPVSVVTGLCPWSFTWVWVLLPRCSI